jgi:hypothetical protein
MEHAHVVTTTTHKTLRGPRGGMILTNDEAIAKRINSAVFPGLQGGPLMHVIAAKAVAFGEALRPEFKDYAKATIANAQALANRLKARGADVVAGGTDTHLALIDLRPLGITGRDADEALERSAITCNKNGVPFDPRPRPHAVRTLPHLSGIRAMARQHPEEPTLVELTIEEVKAMGKQGIDHPSTRPVITGGVVGAIAGAVLPVVTWPVGLFAGAAIALYTRVKR